MWAQIWSKLLQKIPKKCFGTKTECLVRPTFATANTSSAKWNTQRECFCSLCGCRRMYKDIFNWKLDVFSTYVQLHMVDWGCDRNHTMNRLAYIFTLKWTLTEILRLKRVIREVSPPSNCPHSRPARSKQDVIVGNILWGAIIAFRSSNNVCGTPATNGEDITYGWGLWDEWGCYLCSKLTS